MEGRFNVICGDSMAVLPTLPAACCSAVITDPPYGINFKSKMQGGIANDERPFIWWLAQVPRILKETGVLICFCRWDVAEVFKTAIECAGLRVTSQLVWDRQIHGVGDTLSAAAPQHDLAWMAVKGKWQFPNRRLHSVLSHMRAPAHDLVHPTEKPLPLMNELVKTLTNPGDHVVDPFMGAGAVGVACKLNGRNFTGIELERKYALISQSRIENAASLFCPEEE